MLIPGRNGDQALVTNLVSRDEPEADKAQEAGVDVNRVVGKQFSLEALRPIF